MGAFRVPDAGLGHGLPRHLEGTPQLWKGETHFKESIKNLLGEAITIPEWLITLFL